MNHNHYDVIIIGGGVVGSAVARELARYDLSIAVLEKENDVCCGVSGRNTGLLHCGFLYKKGLVKTRFAMEGNKDFETTAEELDIPFRRSGKLTVGTTPEDRVQLERLMAQGLDNGVQGLRMIEDEELHRMVPAVKGSFAVYSATSGLMNPYLYTIALAENAAQNGVQYHFEHEMTAAEQLPDGSYRLQTPKGAFTARWVVNAAGLFSAQVAALLGAPNYRLQWVKGEYILLDKRAGGLMDMPIYPAPDANNVYDIHVTPTMDGNVLIGPTCDEVVDHVDFETTRPGLDQLIAKGDLLVNGLHAGLQIRSFTGMFPKPLDPATGEEVDFQVECRPEQPNLVHLVGITSPGLTCALPIGRHVAGLIAQQEKAAPRPGFTPRRKGTPMFAEMDPETRRRMAEEDPDWGEIVCRCENVTRAEILMAIRNPLGRRSINSIKYRARATMGRCQGGYCETRITAILREDFGVPAQDIRLGNTGSYLFTGRVR